MLLFSMCHHHHQVRLRLYRHKHWEDYPEQDIMDRGALLSKRVVPREYEIYRLCIRVYAFLRAWYQKDQICWYNMVIHSAADVNSKGVYIWWDMV